MIKKLPIFLFAIIVLSPLGSQPIISYGIWQEDSLGIEFKFPRAWFKKVDRSPTSMTVQFAKADSTILRLDFQIRNGDWDVDRFVEESLDQFIRKYPDLSVIQEIRLEEGYQGFQEAHFLVAHYREGSEMITNRFIFTRKGTYFYIIQAKVIRKKYYSFKTDVDLFMKSLAWNSIPSNRWRNDSLNYLSPSTHETTIRYIQETSRPEKESNYHFNSSLEYRPNENPVREMETDPKRPIRDIEPGKNPPEGGVQPVVDPTPGPL